MNVIPLRDDDDSDVVAFDVVPYQNSEHSRALSLRCIFHSTVCVRCLFSPRSPEHFIIDRSNCKEHRSK